MTQSRAILVFAILGAAAVVVMALSLAIGSIPLAPERVWAALRGTADPLAGTLVNDLRMPRTVTAFATGGLLAVAGALMQVLLRNPLADPYIMGVSGGAAVGALSAIVLGAASVVIDAAAFTGALLATVLVFTLAHGKGGWTPTRLLLTGVIVAAGCGAIISLMLALGEDTSLRGMLFWLMGDLAGAQRGPWLVALLAATVLVALPFARDLNVLARGELQARAVGLPVAAVRLSIFGATSLLTAAAVTTAGTIGFVGLVTPHLARLLLGSDHRRVLPAAALLGGVLVTAADLVARTAFAPRQLPVGALTALIGVPLFLVLVRRTSQSL
ncbi:MAG TPA: iron ABC transporter permease [Steroidobacteraceae bacterium]|nr:iron ABC transporter permease [Steroidobacteraceae bacterium]